MVECIKGGNAVCGKLLSSKSIVKSAKDHYTWNGCKGVRIGATVHGGYAPSLADVCEALNENDRTTLEGGLVVVCDADSPHAFWLIHMHPFLSLLSAAAGRLCSCHQLLL